MNKLSVVVFLLVAALAVPGVSDGQSCLDYGDYMRMIDKLFDTYSWRSWTTTEQTGQTIYVGSESRLEAYDVSVPGVWTLLWDLEMNDTPYDIAIAGDYILWRSYHYVRTVRIAGAGAPAVVASTYIGTYGGGDIVVYGNHAYTGAAYGIEVLDVSDPEQPVLLPRLATSNYIDRLDVDGDALYAIDSDDGLLTYDLSAPAAPVLEASWGFPLDSPVFDVDAGRAIITHADSLRVVDVTIPTAPVQLGALPWEGSNTDVMIVDDICYVVGDNGRFSTVDLTDPEAPALLGQVLTGYYSATDLRIDGNVAYVVGDGGVAVVTIAIPTSPPHLGIYRDLGYVTAIAVVGTTAYVGIEDYENNSYENYFAIFDVSDPTLPLLLGYRMMPDLVEDVRVDGTTAYAACDDFGLRILNVADPAVITVLDVVYTPGHTSAVELVGDRAFIASREAGLTIVDVSDPQDAFILNWIGIAGDTEDIAVQGDYAYLCNDGIGLMVYDISVAGPPELLGLCGVPGYPSALTVSGDFAYVAGDEYGFWVVDISDPARPEPVTTVEGPSYSNDLVIQGTSLYLADGSLGLCVYDIADPDNPVYVGAGAGDAGSGAVAAASGLVYVGGDDYFLIALPQCASEPGSANSNLSMAPVLLQNWPNPFNPRTTIRYELDSAQPVTLRIYDLAGRLVRTLASGEVRQAGPHEATWAGRDDAGRSAAAGVYLYELVTPLVRETRRMTLLK